MIPQVPNYGQNFRDRDQRHRGGQERWGRAYPWASPGSSRTHEPQTRLDLAKQNTDNGSAHFSPRDAPSLGSAQMNRWTSPSHYSSNVCFPLSTWSVSQEPRASDHLAAFEEMETIQASPSNSGIRTCI